MGLDRTILLQAFIRIPIQYSDYVQIIRTCGLHENHKGDTFCPLCGDEIKEVNKSAKQMMWSEDLIGDDNFHHYIEGEVMYLFSNLHDCGVETEENIFAIVTSELIAEKIRYFEEKHKEDIRLIRHRIGADVKVEFGFVYMIN